MIKKLILILCAAICFYNCKTNTDEVEKTIKTPDTSPTTPSDARRTVDLIEAAHHKEAFINKDMVKFDINLDFAGNDRLDGTIYLSTDSRFVRIDKNDGSSIIYDGEYVWLTPMDANQSGARFDIFTWSYFFSLPYKLSDDGTQVEEFPATDLYKVTRLSFENGIGDAPDDWYDIYSQKNSHLIDYAGYIVTYGGTPASEAAQNAHAIGYSDYQMVQGIPIATSWNFYNYNNAVDTSTSIGKALLKNISFEPMEPSMFKRPQDAVQIKL